MSNLERLNKVLRVSQKFSLTLAISPLTSRRISLIVMFPPSIFLVGDLRATFEYPQDVASSIGGESGRSSKSVIGTNLKLLGVKRLQVQGLKIVIF